MVAKKAKKAEGEKITIHRADRQRVNGVRLWVKVPVGEIAVTGIDNLDAATQKKVRDALSQL